jgi:diguanylate cyclase (GGDEF)-like protein
VSIDPILALVMVALIANLALIVATAGRFETAAAGREGHADLRPAALDRVIHIGSWVFLFAAASIVVVTGLWADHQAAILLVLATAAALTVVLHWATEGRIPEAWQLAVGGGVRLAFAALLIALTGGASSPFFFALPLLVVGAAVVVRPTVTLALTGAAGAVYVAAIAAANSLDGVTSMSQLALATAGVNLTSLCLVGYVGMAIGREQRRARDDAHRQATVDGLTGLRTRHYLFDILERELARGQRTGRSFCLLMIDLDDLKSINDRHGHLAGDAALRLVGDVIGSRIRRIDTGARFGGDEFVVLLPETEATGGVVLAEKIREGVAGGGLRADDGPLTTSVSVGLATFPFDGESVDELLERADAAMYEGKRGRLERAPGIGVMDVPGAAAIVPRDAPVHAGRQNPASDRASDRAPGRAGSATGDRAEPV